ncbi:ornithine cyclodeaminase [compost metagenome]
MLAILGTGEQAKSHLEAMLLVRSIREVRVWSRTLAKARDFQAEMRRKYDVEIVVTESVQEAVSSADVICTVTASTVPVLEGEWLKPGVHINAIGACRPADRELNSETVRLAKLYVDRLESAHHESGDYLIPLKEGVITSGHIIGEIGELISGNIEGRATADEITLFKGLGLAIEDLAAANFIYNEAVKLQKGIEIAF